ncbi:cytochrome d ubiquinol oxidase subunit II [Parafrankia sp. EUN1f]|uniref:cytochrome d ubiquinol oxidase subunit II n=1 Tax=Parafrankia sp. EUN1f TaxID=102897 RepID=UPI0001C45E1C|nr:cytochrome d ubiquinol oxidase subunit II [Parafrankia sp. EUN1f]EFC83895.1 cytochrome bd ubiquinol oxidase, subunit II [Parafrankia sp. EUN1f]
MTAADLLAIVMVLGLTAYALTGGADFGGGVWDLFARGRDAADQRRLVSAALGPIWEANHVWLIFVVVMMFSGFPAAFGVVGSTLEIPLICALAGIVLRGAAYVYRAYGSGAAGPDHWWGHVFAVSSAITPVALGVAGAALATGDVAEGAPLTPVKSAFGILCGVFALAVTAFLAAVYLCRDAAASAETAHLVPGFRRRALGGAVVSGLLAAALLPLLWSEAPVVADRFVDRSIPFVVISAIGGVSSLVALWRHRFTTARVTAGLAVAGVLWGWAAAQYPDLVMGQATVDSAAAPSANIVAMLIAVCCGLVILVPSLWMLFRLFSSPEVSSPEARS